MMTMMMATHEALQRAPCSVQVASLSLMEPIEDILWASDKVVVAPFGGCSSMLQWVQAGSGLHFSSTAESRVSDSFTNPLNDA